MKKRFWLYSSIVLCSFFFLSCSQEILEENFEETVKTKANSLSDAENCLDSLKVAFEYVARISGYGRGEIWNPTLFDVRVFDDGNDNIIVFVHNRDYPIKIHVNKKRIREYTWYGYLLIALHEWYHIYERPDLLNNEAHEAMVNDSLYREWIMRTFGCDLKAAHWLVYAGTENTPVFEELSDSQKELVRVYMKKYRMKIEDL